MTISKIGYNYLKDLLQPFMTENKLKEVSFLNINETGNQLSISRVSSGVNQFEFEGEDRKQFSTNSKKIQFTIQIMFSAGKNFSDADDRGWELAEAIEDIFTQKQSGRSDLYIIDGNTANVSFDDIMESYVATITESNVTLVNLDVMLDIERH